MNAAPGPGDRVGAWARSNANPSYAPNGVARSGSRSAPNSQYSPSAYGGGGGSLRRKVTRRQPRGNSRVISTYEEEEEGYGSGEYDDGPFELSMIRVKVIIFSLRFTSRGVLRLHSIDSLSR
jgi:neutrophil factor 2